MRFDLILWHQNTDAAGAENRIRAVFEVRVGIVADARDRFLGVVAGFITAKRK